MNSKRVLFVTYNFPPHGGAGVQRSLKFIKYLPQFGWYPWVVTSEVAASPLLDQSLEAEIPISTPVYRVGGFSINRLMHHSRQYHLDRIAVLVNLILQVPDAQIFWALNTHQVIENMVDQAKPSLVYTTSGPYSTHLVGLWVKERFQLPWFADFRDPWSTNLLMPYLPGYGALNRIIERRVLEKADRVACVSTPWLEDLRKNAGGGNGKYITLSNGYDDTDIEPIPITDPRPPFTISHIGSFYANRKPSALIEAVDYLIASNQLLSSEIRVIFVGKNSSKWVPNRLPFIADTYIAHNQLSQIRKETDVYLLILDTTPANMGNYSGKLFEYMASNRPILGIVPKNGVAYDLIRQSGTGIAVTSDRTEIATAILQLFQSWREGYQDWKPNWDIIKKYTRKNITASLVQEFNAIT